MDLKIDTLLQKGRYARVLTELSVGNDCAGDRLDYHISHGLKSMLDHDYENAIAHLSQALNIALPPFLGIQVALVSALRRDARYEEALTLLENISDEGNIKSCRQGFYEQGLCSLALGDALGSLKGFDAALALDNDFASAWLGAHGAILELQGRDAAIEYLYRAMACVGVNGKFWGLVYGFLWLKGDHNEANRILSQHISNYPRRRVWVDGLHALAPQITPQTRQFGLSASLLRYGLSEAKNSGMVLEFGVRRGTSLRHIAAVAKQEVHGFDSFEGLPESWNRTPSGVLRASLPDMPPNMLPNMPCGVSLHVGWFVDSLPDFLQSHPEPVRFINIDSDLYSSAQTILTLLEDRIHHGVVLVFDEMIGNHSWAEDEYRAFCEFVTRGQWKWEVIALSLLTKQVAIRLRT